MTQELYAFTVFLCLGTCIVIHLAQIKRRLDQLIQVTAFTSCLIVDERQACTPDPVEEEDTVFVEVHHVK